MITNIRRRRILVVGLLVMLAASLGCAVAPTAATLVAARLVQGVGAALVVPSSLALLNRARPRRWHDRAVARGRPGASGRCR